MSEGENFAQDGDPTYRARTGEEEKKDKEMNKNKLVEMASSCSKQEQRK